MNNFLLFCLVRVIIGRFDEGFRTRVVEFGFTEENGECRMVPEQ